MSGSGSGGTTECVGSRQTWTRIFSWCEGGRCVGRTTSVALELKVWGDYACFTRPEMKVERVTYPVMTPSSARGVLEAIFWKPEISWVVEEIRVLKEIRYLSILRNEVNSRASDRSAMAWMRAGH